MRLRLAALLVPLALSGCATYGYPGGSGDYGRDDRYERRDRHDRWQDYDAPLFANVEQNGSGLAVRLNRPAHVAIFEIVPGRGVGLSYPRFGRESEYLPSGFSYVQSRGASRYDWYQASASYGRFRNEPRFYLLVASRRPLRTDRFRAGGALRSVLGLSSHSTLDYRTVMSDVVEAVVPYQHDDDWTTDVLAVWPDRRYDRYAADGQRYTRVRCSDGSYVLTAWELARYACGRRTSDRVPPLRPDGPDRDSTRVQKPTRRRPGVPSTGGSRPAAPVDAGRKRPGSETGEGRPPRVPVDVEKGRVRPEGGSAGEPDRPRLPRVREPQKDQPEARDLPRTRSGDDAPARPRDLFRVRETPRKDEPESRDAPRRPGGDSRDEPRAREERPEPPPRFEPARSQEPRRADPPPRAEPRNDSPPSRPEPRNDPPPRAEPRSEPAPRSAPPEGRSRPKDPSA